MFNGLCAVLVAAAASASVAVAPVQAIQPGLPMPRVAVFNLADAFPVGRAPASFTHGDGNGGPVSPAGCHIENVQNPHISTYLQQRENVRATKGNAVARCHAPVPYLSLSVSVLDVDKHQVVAKQARPKEVFNEDYIESLETVVPCINNDPTNYQVIALGASQENGDYYDQVESGKIDQVNCGHA